MKLVLFESQDWVEEKVKQTLSDWELVFVQQTLTADNWQQAQGADVVSVFIDSRVTAEVLDNLKDSLKLIATRSTGFDHIDLAKAQELGITVSNVPHYGENTVAEHAMALILTISRKIFETVEMTERGHYDVNQLRGFDLKDKVLGIYGLGRIGQHLAKMARGFDMKVIAYKRTPDHQLAYQLRIEYVAGIEELLLRSDILSLNCPLTPETKHLINQNNIHLIKPGMILINTARGPLVETDALLKALEQGLISAAGLDVLEEEQYLEAEEQLLSPEFVEKIDFKTLWENHKLIARDDVIFTGHNAFNSHEAVMRILTTTLDNIQKFAAGTPQNVVKPR